MLQMSSALKSVVVAEEQPSGPAPIDREKVCPFLLRVFIRINGKHRPDDYNMGSLPKSELKIYTWPDATFRELVDLIKGVNVNSRRANARFVFSVVYPDKRGKNVLREVGTVHSMRKSDLDSRTLGDRSSNFCIGDHMDVSIFC